jgi:hypothetical protein
MNIKNYYPVYMQGELIALLPSGRNPILKTQPRRKRHVPLSQTPTVRRLRVMARRVLKINK